MGWTYDGEYVPDDAEFEWDPSLTEGADPGTMEGYEPLPEPLDAEQFGGYAPLPDERESPGLPEGWDEDGGGGGGSSRLSKIGKFLESGTGGALAKFGLGAVQGAFNRPHYPKSQKTTSRTTYDQGSLDEAMGNLRNVFDYAKASLPGYQPISIGNLPGLTNVVSQPKESDFSDPRKLLALAGVKL